jgi:hypothetical protein
MCFFPWCLFCFCFGLFETSLQIAQRLEAMAFILADPALGDLVQWHRIEEMQLLAPAPGGGDKVRLLEENQVLGHRLPRHVQMLTQFRQGLSVVRVQLIQQLAAAGVG